MKIRFYNALIYADDKIIDGELVTENEKIIYVGKDKLNAKFDREIDVKGNLIMPGLVNLHAHSSMTLLRGLCDDCSLEEWLYDNMFPFEKCLNEDAYYYGTMQAIKEYVRCGTTSCLDMYMGANSQLSAFKTAGFRAGISIAYNEMDTFKVDDLPEFIKPFVMFHSVYTTDEDDIISVMREAKNRNWGIHTHLQETITEVSNCVAKNQLTPIQYLNSFGFFDNRVVGAHCVHLDNEDIEILKRNNVTVVTNPSSNMKLGSGIAPLVSLMKNNINIAIGTDGPASNNHLDMFKEMFLASTLQKCIMHNPVVLSNNETIKMATINGAKALGFENLGILKEGYLADLIILNINEPNYFPMQNLEKNIIYSANCKDVYLTMINGKIMYENGQYFIGEDDKEVTKKAYEIYKSVLNTMNKK